MSMTDESVLAFEKDLDELAQYLTQFGTLLGLDLTDENVTSDTPVGAIVIGSYSTVKDIHERFKTYL